VTCLQFSFFLSHLFSFFLNSSFRKQLGPEAPCAALGARRRHRTPKTLCSLTPAGLLRKSLMSPDPRPGQPDLSHYHWTPTTGLFHFRRQTFLSQFKSKVGNILTKTAVLRVNLNIDDTPIDSRTEIRYPLWVDI
jgi:hypothetical protein